MDFTPLQAIISVAAFVPLILCFFLLRRKSVNPAAYGFKRYPLVGSLPDFIRNRHRFLDWTAEVLVGSPSGTVVLHLIGNTHGVLTADPLVIEHMLKSNFDNYPRGALSRSLLQDFLGTGIFNADGDDWKIQRKIASHEFNTKSLKTFITKSVDGELQGRLIPLLERAAETARVLDFQDILERFGFDNICKVAFGVDPGCLDGIGKVTGDFMEAFNDAAVLSVGRFLSAVPDVYRVKKFLNLGSEKNLQKSIAIVHNFADKIIRSRLAETDEQKDEDLLSRFIAKQHNNSPEFLRDVVISFILAGRDSTSSALSWFFWLISSRPDVEEAILKELEIIRRKNKKSIGDIYSLDELREMQYLQAAISESMRLYPPVPIDTKTSSEDDILPDGTLIGKNSFITYHAYAMGRRESLWGEDCCEYRPERWLENGVCRQESSFKYPVFHAGPRICLGRDMAYVQMKSIAAAVLQRFEMEMALEEGKSPECLLSFTLRMKDGLPVRVKERIL